MEIKWRKWPRQVAASLADTFRVPPLRYELEPAKPEALDVADVTNSLRSVMVRKMGIVRDRNTLLEAERAIAFWCRYALARSFDAQAGWELQNLLIIARLMIWAALQRQESRGVHYRSDFPQRDDVHWQRHLTCPPFRQEPTAPHAAPA